MALEPIEHAIELIHAGKKMAARAQILGILEVDPNNADAWLWLAACAANREEHSRALREVLRLNPSNRQARKLVLRLARKVVFERTGRDYVAEKQINRELPRRRLLMLLLLVVAGAVLIFAALTAFGIDLVPDQVIDAEPTLTSAEVCTRQVAELRRSMVARCSGLEQGQACLMNGGMAFARQSQGAGDFSLPGDRIRLDNLAGLSAQNYSGDQVWGLALLHADSSSEDSPRFLLIGGAELREFSADLSQMSFSSTPNAPTCDSVAPSGILAQTRQQVRFTINKARIDMIGTLFVASVNGGYFTAFVLDGVAEIAVRGELTRLSAGQSIQLPVDENGDPVGVFQRPELPPVSDLQAVALGDLAQTVAFETPWVVSTGGVENVPEAAPTEVDQTDLAELDSDVIVYSSTLFGSADLFMVDSQGRVKRLTDDPAQDCQPALSSDGRYVVFSSDRNGADDIYLLDLSTSDLKQLTLNAGGNHYPSWADDRIVFTSTRGGTPQIWMMGLDGSSPQMLTSAAGGVQTGQRRGREGALAYSLAEGGIVIDANGEITLLEDDQALAPAWSPDGSQLAYQSKQDGGVHIYLYDLETGETRRLTDQSLSGEAEPAWSPDGAKIAFTSRRLAQSDLFVADVDTGVLKNLVSSGAQTPAWGVLSLKLSAPQALPQGSWSLLPAAITSTLYDVMFISPDSGLAVGENNTVLRYQSGVWGRMDLSNVQSAFNGERLTFFNVDMLSESDAWAVGEGGTIIQLSGNVWRVVESPTRDTLYAVRNGWAVGANGTTLRLGEAGWQDFSSPSQNTLMALYFKNDDDGWAVGVEGTLLHWNGAEWQVQLNSPESDLYGAALPNLLGSWLVGENGLFRRERDTWKAAPLLNAAHLVLLDIQTFPDGTAWAVGRDGALVYGTGSHWGLLPKLTYNHVNAVSFSSPDEGWAVGQSGTLLHYTLTPPIGNLAGLEPATVSEDRVQALAKTWECAILQDATFYHYDLTLEQFKDGTLLASGVLPEYGYTLVTLDGHYEGDLSLLGSEWAGVANYDTGLAWVELREAKVLTKEVDYDPNGVLRLYLTSDGQLKGSLFAQDETGAEVLVGQVQQCTEMR